ncbi:tripartite tricarboxylate transporter permease [Roseomonas xinghualingensis]|uniref:tripartite tricarboxylate transporter permease n=1 Tax=Roseomonas xinghualingensis TaxID=2986475 RepID=UPI0021F0A735|nr:tripartite tricarboxylate transporter permease [Roseomonas sp. SXEYE001]MCV4210223.1 tripartite tricarboxylate transporter permease [Roseomonas sp. SXEYE001]
MDAYQQLLAGFGTALTPANLGYCLLGCLWGTVVGILPGLGPLAGMTLLLPLTFGMDATSAIIMLAGIFYGAMYGGSTTSILVRIPGEAASVMTCLDGHEMARQGRAGHALTVAALGSFVGGTVSILILMLLAPPLAEAMLAIDPAAEAVVILLGLGVVTLVSPTSFAKTLTMLSAGLFLSTVGFDKLTGVPRFTFGSLELSDGLDFVALAIGLFGVSEILLSLERMTTLKPIHPRLREMFPNGATLRQAAPAIARGSIIGSAFGIIPGVSHVVSTFVAYAVEKRLARDPSRFGQGAIEGVAGPETANNATTGTAMIPLLVLGVPSIPATAILLSALMIHGIQPGPMLLVERADVFWGFVASMYVGNAILLLLNVPLVGLFVSLLRIPYFALAPVIISICVIGVYSVSASGFDVWVMMAAGLVGYLLRKFDYDMAPLLLALVLGDRLEESFRRALMMSAGDWGAFISGPALWILLAIGGVLLLLQVAAWSVGYNRRVARAAMEEDG